MSLNDDLREDAQRMLDGMTVHRDRFAKRVLDHVRLSEIAMQRINALELANAKQQGLLDQYDKRIRELQAKIDNPFGSMFGSKA